MTDSSRTVDAIAEDYVETYAAQDPFTATFAGIPGVDPATASRVAELNAEVEAAGSCRCSIIAFAPDDVPAADVVMPASAALAAVLRRALAPSGDRGDWRRVAHRRRCKGARRVRRSDSGSICRR